ncbi:MAG: sensor histidine kinase [Kordiimonas sp.]
MKQLSLTSNNKKASSNWFRQNLAHIQISLFTIIVIGFGQSAYLKSKYLLREGLPLNFSDMFSLWDTGFSVVSTTIVVLMHQLVTYGIKRAFGERAVKLRYTIQFVLSATLGGLAAAGSLIFYVSILHDYPTPPPAALFDVAIVAIIIPLTLIASMETFHYRGAWLQEQYVKEQTQREIISAQFEALKNQLSPHFVFNSFNSLGGLIEEDPKRAQLFLNQLSQVYRYILDNKDKETVSLSRELESVEALLHVQEARHPNTVHVNFEITENDREQRVIPLTLHTLIENVFKHNILSKKAPIGLTVKVLNGEILIVENDLKPKLDVESHHIGIANLSKRYELLVKQGLNILKNANSFRVEVPLVRQEAEAL